MTACPGPSARRTPQLDLLGLADARQVFNPPADWKAMPTQETSSRPRTIHREPRERRITAGWARRRFTVTDERPILDVGSGAFPNAAADLLCDYHLTDDFHRHGNAIVVDRPTVVADASALPFRDGAFAFVIASHLAEHVLDPAALCGELCRVAPAGYIETPSALADRLLHEEYHIWRVSSRHGVLRFRAKRARGRVEERLTESFYRVFYTGQTGCSRPSISIRNRWLAAAVAKARWLVIGILNRTRLMHTRYTFDHGRDLRWEVLGQ